MNNKIACFFLIIFALYGCKNNDGSTQSKKINIEQQPTSQSAVVEEPSLPQLDTLIKGKGNKLVPVVLNKGIAIFDGIIKNVSTNAISHIAIVNKDGETLLAPLPFTIGPYNGQSYCTIPINGAHVYVEVHCDGNWEIKLHGGEIK